MAAPRSFLITLSGVFLLLCSSRGSTTSGGSRRATHERCGFKVQSAAEGSRPLPVSFRADRIEHIKGFRVYLEDKNPEGKQCQHLLLKDPRQLNCSYKDTKLSSQPFGGLTFDTDYMVRVVPFPTLMNESFFPPSFLRTNSCEVLLGSENLVCKPFWKPKALNVSQLGSNLHVAFDQAPASFGFGSYFLFFKLRQDGPFRRQRCKPDVNQHRTTCVLQDVTPGTYAIELRDDDNTTRRETQYHVSRVHSQWAGPIRAMAITVPLVLMSAFATLFTVMCRKKQQENIYSQLDEESSESSNHSAALSAERPWPRPKVFICYSNRDCPKHVAVVQSFAYFLQDFCSCEVVLDLWEHLEMCREGQMSWLSRQLDEAHFIITVCSKGLRFYIEKKSHRGKTPVGRRGNGGSSSPIGGAGGDLFIVGVAMIAEKLRLARQSEGGGAQELSRYMTVYFDFSSENDIPTMLSLAPRFKLMDQLPQLFSRLHAGPSGLAEREPQPLNVSRRNYFRSRSGRSLYVSICNMHQHVSQNPDWFEKQLSPPPAGGAASSSASSSKSPPSPAAAPAPSPPPKPACPPSSGVVLNEVEVNTPPPPEGGEGAPRRNVLLLAPGSGPGPDPCPSPGLPQGSLRSTSGLSGLLLEEPCASPSSSSSAPSILREGSCPLLTQAEEEEGHRSPPEVPPPRDSGIYDSSVPSSELSIPLMDGLSHDRADSASLADSESTSSGLGDEEPPAVTSLLCKAELHHHHHLDHGDGLAPVASL
ncbi:interleukin-17 receptor D isoform X2 [Pseudoliparis swirei]|uniref:interleukin-17 receptor D isoform X2 n=1 Tax=Pseudoliparis swirei TaxID=2059687 RepID=UPI0024BDB61D|nr:interleukin-17 receptor D isoform X2 [Pseudoliparis swirei]